MLDKLVGDLIRFEQNQREPYSGPMKKSTGTLALLLGAFSISAQVAQVEQAGTVFAEWNQTDGSTYVSGTINGVGIRYSGSLWAPTTQVGNSGINYWTEYGHDLPYSPVTGTLPARSDIIAQAVAGTRTITFDSPVLNPVMLICSAGNPSWTVSYTFDQPATVLSSGWGYWNQSGSVTGYLNQNGPNGFIGLEGCGVIGFTGWVSSISWATTPYEQWHGITVALVPEPAVGGFLLVGVAVGLWARRKCAN